MSPRAFVYAAVAMVAGLLPFGASALVVTVSINGGSGAAQGPIQLGTTVPVACNVSQGGMELRPPAGTAALTVGVGTVDSPVTLVSTGTRVWTSGAQWAAAYLGPDPKPSATTVTCAVANTLGTIFTSAPVTVALTPPAVAPPVLSAIEGASGVVFVGDTRTLDAVATDPGGLALTYAWTSTGGTLGTPAASSTTWTAPALAGPYTLGVTVTNSGGAAASRTVVVTTVLSVYQSSLTAPMSYPRRIASNADGDLFVVDGAGALHLLTKRGDRKGTFSALGATAVAVAPDGIYVASSNPEIIKLDGRTGRKLGSIPWEASSAISGLAWDSARNLLWAANFENRRVVAFRQDGTLAAEITSAEGRPLRAVADVAFAPASDTLWIAEKDGMTDNRLHAFDGATATWLRSMVPSGSGLGQVVDTGGIALDPAGRVYVSDAFGGTIQVMTAAGAAIGSIGSKGDVDGYLLQPRGLAFMANGNLAVANSYFNRIERFGTGAALPTCAGDADCDGLPDAWEIAHGLDPNDASDALSDPDGDGLNNSEEYALGTDPRNADTDGDGVSDGAEVAGGFDPLDGTDHRPRLVAGGPVDAPPGLVTISSTMTGVGSCSAAWRQLSGTSVTLREATTAAPSFIARKAGTYRFEGIATCGLDSSAPAVAEVRVLNVAPIADAGRDVVTSLGRIVRLAASFSSDANGDALTYAWEQVVGPPVTLPARGGAHLAVRPGRVGYYAFQLTVTDPAGLTDSATIGVVVVGEELPTAIVTSPVLAANVGIPVTLDASASQPQGVAFTWQQVGGSAELPGVAAPSFTPPAAGLYLFEVTAWNGTLRSPPARVVVLAASAALPTAAATAPAVGAIGAPLTLDGAASTGNALSYQWRQVAGPAAGISGADGATPTVVPFAEGTYAFELTVVDAAGAVSAPAVVWFGVAAPGKQLPVAVATGPAEAVVGQLVVLDGRASTRGVGLKWTQVAGPWVALEGAGATALFRAPSAGVYAFELVVDDGNVRSAPALVTVNVQ